MKTSGNELDKSKIDDSEVDGGEVGYNKVGKNIQKLSKSNKTVGSDFLTPGTKLMFIKLRQTFVKALIFYYFDLERHIRIEMDISSYDIGKVLG